MTDEVVEVNDVGLLDRVTRNRRWEIEKDDGKVTRREQSQQHPIPEDIMAALEQHIGDAQAKITVGAEPGHSKEYGCKAQAFVSVSVTCNNNETDIGAVHGIVQPFVRQLVNADLDQMKEDRDTHMGTTAPAPTTGKVSNPPRANAKPPTAQPVAAAKPGVQRPSFRR